MASLTPSNGSSLAENTIEIRSFLGVIRVIEIFSLGLSISEYEISTFKVFGNFPLKSNK